MPTLTARLYDLPLDGLGVDFYHLAENVHKSCRTVCGEDSNEGAVAGRSVCCIHANARTMTPRGNSDSRGVSRCEAESGRG